LGASIVSVKRVFICLLIVTSTIASVYVRADELSSDDEKVLMRGMITPNQQIAGGILSIVPGFGLGQAVENRYEEKGWIFTVGEATSVGIALAAGPHCIFDTNTPHGSCGVTTAFGIVAGLIKLWEVGDAWIAPISNNQRYEQLHWQKGRVYTGFNIVPAPIGKENAPGLNIDWAF
jgi:hypothetical protein